MSEDGKPAAVMMDGVPFYFVAHPAHEISTVIDVGPFVQAKIDGIRCHRTQVGGENRFAQEAEQIMQDPWFRQEAFILAYSAVGQQEGTETDLLTGL